MTRRARRAWLVAACGTGLCVAAALTLNAFSSSIVFFVGPTALVTTPPPPDRTVRLGGMVQEGSVHRTMVDGEPQAVFEVSDGKRAVEVTYAGILPDLFREGQGVVTMGTMGTDHVFHAQEVLAKHDETYMPREVVDALKKSGRWNPASGTEPPSGSWNTKTGT